MMQLRFCIATRESKSDNKHTNSILLKNVFCYSSKSNITNIIKWSKM